MQPTDVCETPAFTFMCTNMGYFVLTAASFNMVYWLRS